MLSLSSSSSFYSSCVSPKKYDVFLSFRGEDTRKSFADHLYAALASNAIFTFMDDERLKAGKAIAPELFKAIQESWCSIVVFSKTYAFSSWCLEELAEIVKQKNQGGHKIFPIFYDVDPSDLRKQAGRVAEAFAKHEERYKENKDKTQRWRFALTEVANVKGWHLKDGPQPKFIEEIVKTISAILPHNYSAVSDKSLIGISNSQSEELLSKININGDRGKEEKAGKENNGGSRRWRNEEIDKVGKKLRTNSFGFDFKEEEIQKIGKLNWALQERVKSISVENQIWRDLAQTNEATANALRTNLEQVPAAAQVKEDRAADEVDDAQSCCGSSWEVERRTLAAEGGEIKLLIKDNNNKNNEESSSSRLCKNCRKEESCVLLLPCRHLCLCTACGPSLHICPICKSSKNASVHVNMS